MIYALRLLLMFLTTLTIVSCQNEQRFVSKGNVYAAVVDDPNASALNKSKITNYLPVEGRNLLMAPNTKADWAADQLQGSIYKEITTFGAISPANLILDVRDISGEARVSADSGSIQDCSALGGETCSGTYDPGTVIFHVVNPTTNFTRVSWTGAGVSAYCEPYKPLCDFSKDASIQTARVIFQGGLHETVNVRVINNTGYGTVTSSPYGIVECSSGICSGTWLLNEGISFFANIMSGTSVNWTGDCNQSGRNCSVSLEFGHGPYNLTATFN